MDSQTNSQSLAYWAVDELRKAYSNGSVSPVDATKASLAQIENYNRKVNAFCFVDTEAALESAKSSETRWRQHEPLSPIDGIPCSIKDTVQVRGWTSSRGSNILGMDTPSEDDSPCVERLKQAGAVLLGLTNAPEIGWKGVTDSPRHGITRNPWNIKKTPGGSSGGAAVAASLGMGCLHIGTDAGGSIRIPSSFTGVFGLKPSFGRVPNYPPSAFSTLSHVGPITRSVRDAAHMLTVISGKDPRDWYALKEQRFDYASIKPEGIEELKIAFCIQPGGQPVDTEVSIHIKQAVEALRNIGANVEEQEPDIYEEAVIFDAFWHGAVAQRLCHLSNRELEKLDPGLQEVYQKARQLNLVDYMQATQKRFSMGSRANLFHEKYDILLTPTLPITAFDVGKNVPENSIYNHWPEWARFCYPFNLTRQPACSIPCGFNSTGLPIGLQIIGRQFDDITVLRVATAFEAIKPWEMPPINNVN